MKVSRSAQPFLLLAVLGPVTSAIAQPGDAQAGTFHEWWSTFLEQRIGGSTAGYAWVLMRRGETLSHGGAGHAGIDSAGRPGTPMTSATRMQIASASKPITAMALQLALHERGLSLDTPMLDLLGAFAPGPGAGVERVTMRHLLQHRSGYPFGYLWPPRADSTRALLGRDLPHPPGEAARYSNVNYSLARTLLEVIAGQPYEDYVRQRLFLPSGITGASLTDSTSDAFAHAFGDPVRGDALVWDFRDDAGGYGWYMTAMDLARWGAALYAGRLMPRDVVRRALHDSLGWGRATTPSGPAFVHQGQWIIRRGMGVRTAIALLPDSGVAVLFLNTNVPYSPTALLVDAFNLSVPTFLRQRDDRQGRALVHITVPIAAREVRYTVDGSEPGPSSAIYLQPFAVAFPAHVRARGFVGREPVGFVAEMTLGARSQEGVEAQTPGAPPQFPDGLPVATPQSVGLAPAPLAALRQAIGTGSFPNTTSVLVLKDGALVFEEYFGAGGRDTLNDTRSATKSITALAVGAALADGILPSLEESAFNRLGNLAPFQHDGGLKRGITLADFLTMSSALDCNDWDESSPGNEENMYPRRDWSRWAVDIPVKPDYRRDASSRGPYAYCTAGVFLLGQIIQRAAGQPVDAYVERRLLEPLGITARRWSRSPSGEIMTGGGLRLRSRDLAKLGLLVASQGRWDGGQILPADWIGSMLTVQRRVDDGQGYGYLVWQREYASPCGRLTGWYMSGNGGNVVVYLPGQRLVAVVTRRHYNQRGMHQQTVQLLEDHVLAALECRGP